MSRPVLVLLIAAYLAAVATILVGPAAATVAAFAYCGPVAGCAVGAASACWYGYVAYRVRRMEMI